MKKIMLNDSMKSYICFQYNSKEEMKLYIESYMRSYYKYGIIIRTMFNKEWYSKYKKNEYIYLET